MKKLATLLAIVVLCSVAGLAGSVSPAKATNACPVNWLIFQNAGSRADKNLDSYVCGFNGATTAQGVVPVIDDTVSPTAAQATGVQVDSASGAIVDSYAVIELSSGAIVG